jgi:hypothetical protein
MENNFYKNIYNITLCNFWYKSSAWNDTQHIQNLDTEDLWILRYSRSRIFTFLFFMPKMSGNSSGKNNKSCMIFHIESKKIGFAFFWFFYDFIRIFKVSAKAIYYLRLGFTGRSLELSILLRIGPWFTKNTLERTKETQCSPLAMEAAVPAEIGRLRWRIRPGKEWGRKRGSPGLDLWPETRRKGARWRLAAVAGAGASAPVEGRRRRWCPTTRGGGVGSCGVARTLGRWW